MNKFEIGGLSLNYFLYISNYGLNPKINLENFFFIFNFEKKISHYSYCILLLEYYIYIIIK